MTFILQIGVVASLLLGICMAVVGLATALSLHDGNKRIFEERWSDLSKKALGR